MSEKSLSELLIEHLDYHSPDEDTNTSLIEMARKLETELEERREEIDNLETELAALKNTEAAESRDADLWANQNKNANKLLVAINDFAVEKGIELPPGIAEQIATRLKSAIIK